MKRSHPEDNLQRLVVDYLRFVLPFDSFRVAHVPNGGYRSKIEASILKGDWMTTNEVPYAEVHSLAEAKAALASWGVLTQEAA